MNRLKQTKKTQPQSFQNEISAIIPGEFKRNKILIVPLLAVVMFVVGFAAGWTFGSISTTNFMINAGMALLDLDLSDLAKAYIQEIPSLMMRIPLEDKIKLGLQTADVIYWSDRENKSADAWKKELLGNFTETINKGACLKTGGATDPRAIAAGMNYSCT